MKTPTAQQNKTRLAPARAADIPALLTLAKRFHRDDGHPMSPRARGALKKAVRGSPYAKVWRILKGGALCGYAAVTYSWSIEFGGKTAYLDDLYIDPMFRGLGIGVAVMAQLEDKAKRDGCCIFQMEVEKANKKARRFYMKRKFVDTKRALLIKQL